MKWMKFLGMALASTFFVLLADHTNHALFGTSLNTFGEYYWNFCGVLAGAFLATAFPVS